MTKQESEAEFKRLAELLVKRGFARVSFYSDTAKVAAFHWTPAGEMLQRHLRQLFDIPKVSPADLTPEQVTDLVMLILFTSPSEPVV